LIRELLAREGKDVVVTRGSTYENRDNLAPGFFDQIIRKYEGTRLGRQELMAEVLLDTPGALWTLDMIDRARREKAPDLVRVVVALDPAASSHEGSDETGITVVGKDERGHAYLLEDLSGKYAPAEWARVAINAYYRYGADRVIAETNQGGEMVENTLRMVDANVAYSSVHASRGKFTRAEPVAALYEQGRVHHVGCFPELEDQMTSFVADLDRGRMGSPDRLDSAVWGLTELLVEKIPFAGLLQYYIDDTARMKRERGEVVARPVATAEAAPELTPARAAAIAPKTAPSIVLPATLRCAPHRQFQAFSGLRYAADELGQIIVHNVHDVADLLRSGCELV
jgi:predicted phage terminase large subunit-like protein